MKVLLRRILAVVPHPNSDNLNVVAVEGIIDGVIANKDENGNPRWKEGDVCVYVPENAIIPDDVLKERGYWNDEKGKGLLGGSKGNRVKMQRFAGLESSGLIFQVGVPVTSDSWQVGRGVTFVEAQVGDDVAYFFGITEYVPA